MHGGVWAVLLAAGSAARMGRPKQFLPLGSKTVIDHCISAISASGTAGTVVVLAPHQEEISVITSALPVTIAFNDDSSSGMAGSVRAGLTAIGKDASGVLVCLADHPLVLPETMAGLIALHKESPASIVIPSINMRRGHPTLFPREVIQDIFFCSSLRDVIVRHASSINYLYTKDEGVLLDMDTPEDYEQILLRIRGKDSQ